MQSIIITKPSLNFVGHRYLSESSHIARLGSPNIIATRANDEWIAPLGKLTNLKRLRFTNNGKFTDAGAIHLAKLSKLKSLEIGS